MSKKHNCKHERGMSRYKQRLADRGLGRTPTMRWTGMTTLQIQAAFAKLPHYKWMSTVGEDGRTYQRRVMMD